MTIIKEIKGDIIQLVKSGNYSGMVHGCNCFHTMGAGLAPQVKSNFPEAYKSDKVTGYGDITKLGTLSSHVTEEGCYIINGYTQYHTGANAEYCAVMELFNSLDKLQYTSRVFPKGILVPAIGCGIGGLDIKVVKEIINKYTPHLDIIFVEYYK